VSTGKAIDIPAPIDANKTSSSRIWIPMMVGVTVMMDGFES